MRRGSGSHVTLGIFEEQGLIFVENSENLEMSDLEYLKTPRSRAAKSALQWEVQHSSKNFRGSAGISGVKQKSRHRNENSGVEQEFEESSENFRKMMKFRKFYFAKSVGENPLR